MANQEFFDLIKAAMRKKILYLPHAVRQMAQADRMISPDDVRDVLENGEIIEYHINDPRGSSCLILCQAKGRPVHVVCAPKDDYLAVITAYIPAQEEWDRSFKKRKKS